MKGITVICVRKRGGEIDSKWGSSTVINKATNTYDIAMNILLRSIATKYRATAHLSLSPLFDALETANRHVMTL